MSGKTLTNYQRNLVRKARQHDAFGEFLRRGGRVEVCGVQIGGRSVGDIVRSARYNEGKVGR